MPALLFRYANLYFNTKRLFSIGKLIFKPMYPFLSNLSNLHVLVLQNLGILNGEALCLEAVCFLSKKNAPVKVEGNLMFYYRAAKEHVACYELPLKVIIIHPIFIYRYLEKIIYYNYFEMQTALFNIFILHKKAPRSTQSLRVIFGL